MRNSLKQSWTFSTLAIVTLAILAFWNGLGGEFVLDDRAFMLDNPKMTSTHPLAYFFTENLWFYSNVNEAYGAIYRPISVLLGWALIQAGITGPLGWHVYGLLLHILVCLMVLATIRRLMPGVTPLAAGLAAGLFAVHPVHSEAIAWAGASTHALVTAFLLAAFLMHTSPNGGRNPARIIGAWVLFSLALLTYEMAVTFPLFILLHDRITHKKWRVLPSIPYFLLLGVYLVIRGQVLGESLPLTLTKTEYWLRMPVFVMESLRHLLIPWPQPLYLHMPEDWGLSVTAMITAMLWVLVGIWVSRHGGKNRYVALIAFVWIAVLFLPPAAAAFSPSARFALRTLYLPSVGLCLLLATIIDSTPLFRRKLGLSLAGCVMGLSLIATLTANREWADDGKVYTKIVTWHPAHHVGYLGLGRYHERTGNAELALVNYEKSASLALGSDKAGPLEAMALMLGQSGSHQRSLDLFRKLIVIDPRSSSAWNGIGNNLWALGRFNEALAAYQQALRAAPKDQVACYNLVIVLNKLNRADEAAPYVDCAGEQGSRAFR